MKKNNILMYGILVVFSVFLLTGCGVNNVQTKTEFYIGEEAKIDNYLIICKNYDIEGEFLKVNLELSNKNNQDKTVSFRNNFEIYNTTDSDIVPENISSEKVEIVGAGESIDIELEFDITDMNINVDDYKILFYSGVATNNVAFILEEV